jgi:class 3 adenylate cyclase
LRCVIEQVFSLLETVFREFDSIAKKRRIFKVETVGDCYVAVSGKPQNHATCRMGGELFSQLFALTPLFNRPSHPSKRSRRGHGTSCP